MANNYFVTGATGAIGSALIPLLLKEQDSRIWLLIRADSPEHLKCRLEELFEFWEMDQNEATNIRQRLIPLQGDTDQIHFGLSDDIYATVAKQCSHIIHCAGVVRMNLPLEAARHHALGSTRNIVELALACRTSGLLQKIEFVSTVGVGGRRSGVLPETWITEPRTFHNSYEQSKAEAEDYLREQIQLHNLPVTVHRPSMVVGDSKTGKIIHFQIFYYLCEFLSGRRTYGILPWLSSATLDTVPVDYIAQVIRWSCSQQDAIGKIFHLCSGPKQAIPLNKLCQLVRQAMKNKGIKLPIILNIPSAIFTIILKLVTLLANDSAKRSLKAAPIFIDYLADRQAFDCIHTRKYIMRMGGPLPPEDINYLNIVLSRYFLKQ